MIIVLINIDRKAYKKFCPQNFLYENRLIPPRLIGNHPKLFEANNFVRKSMNNSIFSRQRLSINFASLSVHFMTTVIISPDYLLIIISYELETIIFCQSISSSVNLRHIPPAPVAVPQIHRRHCQRFLLTKSLRQIMTNGILRPRIAQRVRGICAR